MLTLTYSLCAILYHQSEAFLINITVNRLSTNIMWVDLFFIHVFLLVLFILIDLYVGGVIE